MCAFSSRRSAPEATASEYKGAVMLKQTYQQDEAEQILRESVRRAAEQEAAQATGTGTVSYERLVAMAEELGVSPDTLAAVLNDRAAEGAKEQARAAEQATEQQERRAFIVERQGDFYPHLWSYIGVNVMLIAINLMTSHGPNHLWAIYPMLGWGIGLFCHAMSALPTRGPTFEKEFAAWQTKRREKAEKLRRKAERERAAAAAAAASAQAKSARAKGARAYDSSAPGDAAAEAVRQVAGAVQDAVGVAAHALDDALRSLPREWPRSPRAPQRPEPPRAPWWTDNDDKDK
jgi:chemotaxis protein histidine kinase CheA